MRLLTGASAVLVCMTLGLARAADGTWTNTVGGAWSDSANWSGGVVAGGFGATARFNVVPGVTVTADTPVAVGKLQFDSASGNNWSLRGGPVTLEAAVPTVQVNSDTVSLYAPLASTNGLRKLNNGTVRFYGRNAIDGEVRIDTGTLDARGDLLTEPASGPLTQIFSTGTPVLRFEGAGGPVFTLSGQNNRENEQAFVATSLEYNDYLTVNFSGSGSTRLEGGPLSGTGLLGLFGNGDVQFDGAPAFEGSLRMRTGRLAFRAASPKIRRPAYGAAAHFDASRTDTFVFQPENGTNFIVRWNSLTGGRYAAHDGYVNPRGEQVLPFLAPNAQNGLPAVDFGKMYATNMAYRSMGAYLLFDAELTDVRTAFIVLKSENFVLCSRTLGHYHRSNNGWTTALLANRNETLWSFRAHDATAWKNGAVINPFSVGLSGTASCDVLCFENGGNAAQVGTFAYDRSYRFGGQVIAEVLLYTRVLTPEERLATEDYLRAKWQNAAVTSPVADVAVRDYYSEGAVRELEVAPDAVVRAGRFSGTRVAGLAGGGRLELMRGGLTPVQPLTVKNGTLALTGAGDAWAPAPATSPISNVFFHVDASRQDTMTVDMEGRVLEWRGTGYAADGRAAYAVNTAVNPPPTLSTNALNGLPFVDFGKLGGGQMMLWNHTNTTIQTAFLVFADPGLDSWLLGDTGTTCANFHRGTGGGILYTGYVAEGLVSGQTFLNGRAVDPQRTFLVKEPAVLTFALTSNRFARASAFACDRWVADKTFRTGDQKLCEVVLYDRYLNRDERRAVEAWLMRKWLPVEPAGYEATDGREIAGEIRAVPATGDSAAIDVSAGKVTVGALSGTGALLKTGGGTLAVAGFADFAGPLQLNEGTVEVQARVLPEPFPLPGGVVFHLDASLSGSVLCEADGISVTNLLDASAGPRSARPPVGYPRPQRVTGALNGLPVIDFGASGTGCCLLWDAPVKTVRSVFWVIGSQAGGGMPLGTKESGDGTDFLRADVLKSGIWNGGSSKTLNGATRIDGRLVNGALEGFNGGYQVMSLITAEDATASAFAADRFVGADAARMARTGGQRLGEVLVFNRVLSDLERRDVEAYLTRKWFGRLPQGYAGAGVELAKVESGGGDLRAQDSDATVTIRSLLGTEDVIKTGGHTLSLYQAHAFAGRLIVSNGVLALSGIPISPSIPQAGMLMHMDAAATNSFTLVAENGTNFITRWNSLSGPRYAAHDGLSRRPYLLDSELNGRPVVEFGPYYDQSADRYNGAYLDWDQEVNTIKTVFLVLGSQAGGNFLMTSREANTAHFHRAYDAYEKVSVNAALLATGRTEVPACLMSSGAYASADGVRINPFATTPSGGYQVFCFQTDDTAAVTAGTFARDRTYRFGGQRLAEVILYDRVLTAEERDQVEAYLQDKWFGRAYGAYVRDVPLNEVFVGADGVLDLTGETRSVATLSGSGTVSNGTIRVTEVLDVGGDVGDIAVMAVKGNVAFATGAGMAVDYLKPAHDRLTISGMLGFDGAGIVTVRLPQEPATGFAGRLPLAVAGSIAGIDNLPSWTIHGLPSAYTGALVVNGSTLYLEIALKGTVMLVK